MDDTSSQPAPPPPEHEPPEATLGHPDLVFVSGILIDWGELYEPSFTFRRWSIETSTDTAAVAVRKMNCAMIEIAVQCVPHGTADVVAHHARLQSRLSLTRCRAETYTDIGLLCARMPRLKAHLLRGMLSFDHLRLLARSADGIRPDDTVAVEKALIAVLTPRRDSQVMPGPRAMVKKILKAVHRIDELARPVDHTDPEPPPVSCAEVIGTTESARTADTVEPPAGIDPRGWGAPTRRVSVDTYDPCATVITATLPPEEAEEVIAVLDAVCREMSCSRADGLLHLVRGTADVSVTLNIYREINSEVAATSAGHWLDAVATDAFMERVTQLRVPGHEATDAYTPTRRMVEFLEGVYTGCTFPGCEVPAAKCDIDHVRRYNHGDPDSGGPTDTGNLHPLCRSHHLLKTLGWVDATKGSDGAVMWSSVDDGHTYVTEPTGPLAGFARTSFASRATRRYRTVREHNERRKAVRASQQAVLAAARRASAEEVPF